MTCCRHVGRGDCTICEDHGEQRRDNEHLDPITERDYDRLEAGPWWNYPPDMAPREGW